MAPQNKTQNNKIQDIHFSVGLILEYTERDEREEVKEIAERIQSVYDMGQENSREGLKEILENLRKLKNYMPSNNYHTDLIRIVTNGITELLEEED